MIEFGFNFLLFCVLKKKSFFWLLWSVKCTILCFVCLVSYVFILNLKYNQLLSFKLGTSYISCFCFVLFFFQCIYLLEGGVSLFCPSWSSVVRSQLTEVLIPPPHSEVVGTTSTHHHAKLCFYCFQRQRSTIVAQHDL